MENKKYDEFIGKHDIRVNVLNGVDILVAHKKEIAEDPDSMDFMKNNKQEIIARIQERHETARRKALERETKIEAIEGLKEIEQLALEIRLHPTATHETTVAELCEKYPRAAAYRKAESYKSVPCYKRAAAGAKAMERIINGEDCEAVIIEMINEVESPSAYGLAWV